MPSKTFIRILNGVKITVIVENTTETPSDILDGSHTKKTRKMDIGWVLSQVFNLEYTCSQSAWDKMIERRKLFCKKQFDSENFTKEEGDLLAQLTTELSNDYHWHGNNDTLYQELFNELNKFKELELLKNKPILTESEKKYRLEKAKQLFDELKRGRGLIS